MKLAKYDMEVVMSWWGWCYDRIEKDVNLWDMMRQYENWRWDDNVNNDKMVELSYVCILHVSYVTCVLCVN